MSDPIVDRIDALVRKRRSFVATAAPARREPLPSADDRIDAEIPVLTEVVDIEAVVADIPQSVAVAPFQPMLDALAADLAIAIEERLALDLPEILGNALDNLQAELRANLAESVSSATRDFLARRQQLRLPFPTD